MGVSQYLGPALVGGLNAPHYLDGRLLTAQDLRDERSAALTRSTWLARAAGVGVVAGFTVQGQGSAALEVSGGEAIAQSGALLNFAGSLTLSLAVVDSGGTAATPDLGQFATCGLQSTAGSTGLAAGAYVLSVIPTQALAGLAPTAALGSAAGGCEPRWDVDGLRFRAIKLDTFESFAAGATPARRRNLLAHWCLGSARLPDLPLDPFTFPERFDGLGGLADLTEDDVPLAVFDWDGAGLRSVDLWSSRRRPVHPFALTAWGGLVSDWRVALAQARFLQFQDQLALELSRNPNPVALDLFRFLPPAGFLPLRLNSTLATEFVTQGLQALATLADGLPNNPLARVVLGQLAEFAGEVEKQAVDRTLADAGAGGVDLDTFFGEQLPQRIGLIDPDSIDFCLQRSWYDEAIDLDGTPAFDLLMPGYILASIPTAALLDVLEERFADLLQAPTRGTLLEQLGGPGTSELLAAAERLRLARSIQTIKSERFGQLFRLSDTRRLLSSGISSRLLSVLRSRLDASETSQLDVAELNKIAAAAAKPYVLFVKRLADTQWFTPGERR